MGSGVTGRAMGTGRVVPEAQGPWSDQQERRLGAKAEGIINPRAGKARGETCGANFNLLPDT
jgi:hypothetical protein